MSIDDYTEYGEIRSILGVSVDELPDTEFEGDTLWYTLKLDFADISASLLTDYVSALGESPRTTEATALIELTKLFAAYATAYQLLDSLALFSPKMIIEGKSNLTRYSDSPYKNVIERVSASYLRFKKKLKKSHELFSTGGQTATSVIPLMGSSSPNYDPVIGS